jgi:hypothetical protein
MAADTRSDLQAQYNQVEKELGFYYNKLGLTSEENRVVQQLELNLKQLEAALKML